MKSSYLKYDDSGHCDLAPLHHFVPILDDGGKVGIFCIYCDYVLFEHVSNTYVTQSGELVEGNDSSIVSPGTDDVLRTLSLQIPQTQSALSRAMQILNILVQFWKKIAF